MSAEHFAPAEGPPFRILALDGGGAKGFYTLGVLKELESMLGAPLYERFDLIFGTSPSNEDPADAFLFINARGRPLTRFGVRYLLRKHVAAAARSIPSLRDKRINPHSLRHYVARPTISAQTTNASCFLGNLAVRGVGPQLITRHSFHASQVLQKGQQLIAWAITARPAVTRVCLGEGLLLHRECGVEVYLGSLDMLMTKPQCNGGPIDTFLKHINGHRVSQTVDGDAFFFKRGTDANRGAAVLVEQVLNAVNGEPATAGVAPRRSPVGSRSWTSWPQSERRRRDPM